MKVGQERERESLEKGNPRKGGMELETGQGCTHIFISCCRQKLFGEEFTSINKSSLTSRNNSSGVEQ